MPGAAQQWFCSLAPGQLTSLDIQMVVGQGITPVIPSKAIIDVCLLFIIIILIILLEELLINGKTCQAKLPLVGRHLIGGDMGSTTHKVSKPGRSHGAARWAGVPSASGEALTHSGKAFWCWDLGVIHPFPSALCAPTHQRCVSLSLRTEVTAQRDTGWPP